jgi:glycine/serine hydroxymethyltransferase
MKESEMRFVGEKIVQVIRNIKDEAVIARVKGEVVAMASRFPIYPE